MNTRITLAHVLIMLLLCFTGGIVILHTFFPTLPLSSYGLGLLLCLSIVTMLFSTRYVKRARLSHLTGREAMSPEEICRQYFDPAGLRQEVLVRQWREAANNLELPAELLRPTDRFDTELKPLAGWPLYDDQIEDLFAWATRRAKALGTTIDLTGVQTLGDFVTLLARLETGRAAKP